MARLALLFALLLPATASAGPTGGGGGNGGGGGRLGDVSGGMRGGGGGGGGGGGQRNPDAPRVDTTAPIIVVPAGIAVVGAASSVTRKHDPKYDGGPARGEFYLGAQKVHESDGAFTVELGIRDGLFRLGGSITRFYETQHDGSQLTLTMPQLLGGFRIDDRGPTRVYLELGFANAKTKGDPVMDSSVTGAVAGVRVEHALARNTTLLADAHEMILEDGIRAHSARIGIKVGVLQGSFRVLDFNIGPALYGPELGLRF